MIINNAWIFLFFPNNLIHAEKCALQVITYLIILTRSSDVYIYYKVYCLIHEPIYTIRKFHHYYSICSLNGLYLRKYCYWREKCARPMMSIEDCFSCLISITFNYNYYLCVAEFTNIWDFNNYSLNSCKYTLWNTQTFTDNKSYGYYLSYIWALPHYILSE